MTGVLQESWSKTFGKFTGNTRGGALFLQSCTQKTCSVSKIEVYHSCILLIFSKIFRTYFLQNTLRHQLLNFWILENTRICIFHVAVLECVFVSTTGWVENENEIVTFGHSNVKNNIIQSLFIKETCSYMLAKFLKSKAPELMYGLFQFFKKPYNSRKNM